MQLTKLSAAFLKVGLLIPQLLIFGFLVTNANLFVSAQANTVKILTSISFLLFFSLFVLSCIAMFKLHKRTTSN